MDAASTPTPHQRASLAWRHRKLALDLCPQCGREPLHQTASEKAPLGIACILKQRKMARARMAARFGAFKAYKPWRPGGVGRPVKWVK